VTMSTALLVYALCALTSAAVAFLLLRGWRRTGAPLLLWSGLCFVGFFINNALLVVDERWYQDLSVWRSLPALAGVALLLYGLVWRSEE
jgi:drug/metabolite transporter (DMT)-like permease